MKYFLLSAVLLPLIFASVEAQDFNASLIDAARRGDVAAAQAALTHGAQVDARSTEGWTPLIFAVNTGNLELTRLLVEKGADVNARSWSQKGSTALAFAAQNGNVQVVSLLLDHQADVNERAKNGQTPLCSAVANKHLEAAQLLIYRGADVGEIAQKSEGDPFFILGGVYYNGEIIKPAFLYTPLMTAALQGDLPMMELLLKNGAILEQKNNTGATALMEVSKVAQPASVKFLIEKGGDVNCRDVTGHTALIYAAYNGQLENIKLLLAAGADPHAAASNNPNNPKARDYDAVKMAQQQADPEAAALVLEAQKRVPSLDTTNSTAPAATSSFPDLTPEQYLVVKWNAGVFEAQRDAAQKGDIGAQFEVGIMYKKGNHVHTDLGQAVEWLCRAADAGNAPAQFELAEFYTCGDGEPRDAGDIPLSLYRKAANAGNVEAQRRLAARYRVGFGVPLDYVQAIRWCRVAARNGDEESQNNLKAVDARGDPLPQKVREAARFAEVLGCFVKAVNQRNAEAQVQLGDWYATGHLAPKDSLEACAWYTLAASGGSKPAAELRDKILADLDSQQKLDVEARKARLLRDPDR